ncbi:hypothetical protein NKH77_48070 [Streptomyces sp. M19]
MSVESSPLGDYVRARRELVTPSRPVSPSWDPTGAGPAPGGGRDARRYQRRLLPAPGTGPRPQPSTQVLESSPACCGSTTTRRRTC